MTKDAWRLSNHAPRSRCSLWCPRAAPPRERAEGPPVPRGLRHRESVALPSSRRAAPRTSGFAERASPFQSARTRSLSRQKRTFAALCAASSGELCSPGDASREGPEVPRPARAAAPREDTAGRNAPEARNEPRAARRRRRLEPCERAGGPRAAVESAEGFLDFSIVI